MTRPERHAEEHRDEASMIEQPRSRHRAGLNMDLSPTVQDDRKKMRLRMTDKKLRFGMTDKKNYCSGCLIKNGEWSRRKRQLKKRGEQQQER